MMTIKNTIPAYEALAAIYDEVMAHVDYEHWAEYIDQLVDKHGSGRKIYDISCGTGTCCAELYNLGYQVWGSDNSWPMVKQAVKKFNSTPLQNCFFCASMEYPAIRFQPDVIVSLYDSINYLIESAQWMTCLSNVASLLKPGGLFIFDVSTILNSQQDFANLVHKEQTSQGEYVRKSTFNSQTCLQKNVFEIRFRNKKSGFKETHVQKIRALKEVEQFIKASPLNLVAGYEDFSLTPFSEECERVHFVLIKPN